MIFKRPWSDEKIIAAIRSTPQQHEEAVYQLYHHKGLYPIVQKIVRDSRGSEEDAKDVYQECIVALYWNLFHGRFQGESTIKTYFYSIARNIWLRTRKKRDREAAMDLSDQSTVFEGPEQWIMSEQKKDILRQAVQKLKKRCQDIIQMWSNDYTMLEIAEIVGLKGDEAAKKNAAKKETYRCRNRLRDLILGHDFYNAELSTE